MGNAFRPADSTKLQLRPQDPVFYGYLCPRCNSRYGEPQRNGAIDVKRCKDCPTLGQQQQIESNKRGEPWVSKRSVDEARQG